MKWLIGAALGLLFWAFVGGVLYAAAREYKMFDKFYLGFIWKPGLWLGALLGSAGVLAWAVNDREDVLGFLAIAAVGMCIGAFIYRGIATVMAIAEKLAP